MQFKIEIRWDWNGELRFKSQVDPVTSDLTCDTTSLLGVNCQTNPASSIWSMVSHGCVEASSEVQHRGGGTTTVPCWVSALCTFHSLSHNQRWKAAIFKDFVSESERVWKRCQNGSWNSTWTMWSMCLLAGKIKWERMFRNLPKSSACFSNFCLLPPLVLPCGCCLSLLAGVPLLPAWSWLCFFL